MDSPLRGVVAVFVVLLIIGLLAFARGEPFHGSTTQSASIVVVAA
jgi:hypothetical protein